MSHFFSHLTCAAYTDLGRKRKNNEDAFGRYPENGMFCVADGMGGAEDGEVASQAVVEGLAALFERLNKNSRPYSGAAVQAWVAQAMNDVSAWIYNRAEERGTKGTGSTFIGVCFDPANPGTATALHAGDSRLYLQRKKALTQITRDHSAAALAGVKDEKDLNPMFRGMVMRAVGVAERVELERTPFEVEEGDVVLLCSDGLTRMVEDKEILKILRKAGDVETAARALIDRANQNGGVDNVTVVLIRVGRLPVVERECAQDFPGVVPPDKGGESETHDTSRVNTDTDSQRPYVYGIVTPSTSRSAEFQLFEQEVQTPTENALTPDTVNNTAAGLAEAGNSPKRGKRVVIGSVVGGLFCVFVLAHQVGWLERKQAQNRVLASGTAEAGSPLTVKTDPAMPAAGVTRPQVTAMVSGDKAEKVAEHIAREQAEAAAKAEATRLAAVAAAAQEETERKKAKEAQHLATEQLAKAESARLAAAAAAQEETERKKVEEAQRQAAARLAKEQAEAAAKAETMRLAAVAAAQEPSLRQTFTRLAQDTAVLERFVVVATSFDDENAQQTAKAVLVAAQAIKGFGKDASDAEFDRPLADFIGALANAAGYMNTYLDNEWMTRISGLTQPEQVQEAGRLVKQMEGQIQQRKELGELSKDETRKKLDALVRMTAACVKQWQEIPGLSPTRR